MVNRKLIRPNLAQVKNRLAEQPPVQDPIAARPAGAGRRRPAPSEQTHAEAFYYLKQMNTQTPMIVVLDDGERLEGHIEWYDRGCLKVHRQDGPNLLVYKHCIRYLYKAEDDS
jgi:sRNA-binding regulator protein Hfq